jgi:CRP-like cAMP-binding protein
MEDSTQARHGEPMNRLLAALGGSDLALLQPHLHSIRLTQGVVLQEQETPIEHVYFPLGGAISLVSVMEGGEVVEAAMVGREGAVGVFGGQGRWNAFSRAVVQLPGISAVIPVAQFQAAVARSDRIRDLILRFKETLLGQVQQTAACNALHPLEARLARWLLQLLDRADDPTLPVTQDFIAHMLAVRRTTVTLIAGKLQAAGLISYRRGHIVVHDRLRLEEAACECYHTIRRRTEAVFVERDGERRLARAPTLPNEVRRVRRDRGARHHLSSGW